MPFSRDETGRNPDRGAQRLGRKFPEQRDNNHRNPPSGGFFHSAILKFVGVLQQNEKSFANCHFFVAFCLTSTITVAMILTRDLNQPNFVVRKQQ